ncbi:zinc ribbon domain-containing protein [Anaerovibrio lipolyticus]|uniref:zinc ribbon domain-containing protein n=1 Tax=Anaerovibrio lipolyticus TaxID=82374 RepID=UPI000481689B|nr:zinc ribbon domain-containing protein [Anaerovibrio lipolyticus]
MFCIQCGTKLPDNAKFCFNCGAQISIPDNSVSNNVSNNTAIENPEETTMGTITASTNPAPIRPAGPSIEEQIQKADSLSYFKKNPKEKEALVEMLFSDEQIISVGAASMKIDNSVINGVLVLTTRNAIFLRRSRFVKDISLRLNWDKGKNCRYDKGFLSSDVFIDGQKFNINKPFFDSMKWAFDKVHGEECPKSESELFNVMLHIDNADKQNYFKYNPKAKKALANIITENEKIDVVVEAVISGKGIYSDMGALTFTDKRVIYISRSSFGKDTTFIMDWPQEIHYSTAYFDNLTIGSYTFTLGKEALRYAEFAIKKYQS